MTKSWYLEDAETVFITYGCSTRSAMEAMARLRAQGVKAGMLQLQTVWPLRRRRSGAFLPTPKWWWCQS